MSTAGLFHLYMTVWFSIITETQTFIALLWSCIAHYSMLDLTNNQLARKVYTTMDYCNISLLPPLQTDVSILILRSVKTSSSTCLLRLARLPRVIHCKDRQTMSQEGCAIIIFSDKTWQCSPQTKTGTGLGWSVFVVIEDQLSRDWTQWEHGACGAE